MNNNDLECWFCKGDGTLPAFDCENCCCEDECQHCSGTGWNADRVDVAKWKEAEKAFQKEHRATCALQDEKRRQIGRVSLRDHSQTLMVSNFLLEE